VILGEGLAARLFGTEEALGKRLRFGRAGPAYTVVGIAGGISNSGYAAREPEYYVVRKHLRDPINPQAPETVRRATLLIRSPWTPRAAQQWLRNEVAKLDAALPLVAEPLSQRITSLSARPRFQAVLLSLFAALGLLMAMVGLYGVISLLVTQRTREMGIRLALGASPSGVALLTVQPLVMWCAAGLIAGLTGSWLLSRWIGSLLYETSPRDPAAWAAACCALLMAALVAAWIPSRRAGRLDPVAALRRE
jgi:hypothetical protein